MTMLDELPEEYLECRADRHINRHITDEDLVYRKGVLVRLTRVTGCPTCGRKIREDLNVPEFTRVPGTRPRPEYPPGYLLKGAGRPDRGEVLGMLYTRKRWLTDREVSESATTRDRMLGATRAGQQLAGRST